MSYSMVKMSQIFGANPSEDSCALYIRTVAP